MNTTSAPCIRQQLLDAGINVFALDLLVESFLRSKLSNLATAMQDKFLVVLDNKGKMPESWVGLEISLNPVFKDQKPVLSSQPIPIPEPLPSNETLATIHKNTQPPAEHFLPLGTRVLLNSNYKVDERSLRALNLASKYGTVVGYGEVQPYVVRVEDVPVEIEINADNFRILSR